MPSKDINVRRATARRCYRNKVARDKEIAAKRVNEASENKPVFSEIRSRVIEESLNGWVSPQRIKNICSEYSFTYLRAEEIAWQALYWWNLWGCLEAGVFNGQTPFLRDDKLVFEYFKKRAPKTQKSANKAELLILNTMIKFMKKGYDVKVFDKRYK